MSLTPAQELLIAKALANKTAAASTVAGAVIPSPVFFVDKADFWATVSAKNTQILIEQTPIVFVLISLLKRVDDSTDQGCPENPVVNLTYNFHFFRQYDYERSDEADTPDDFLKRHLKSYQFFKQAFFEVWNDFLGIQDLQGLPDGVTAQSNAFTQDEYFQENDVCRYFLKDQIRGFYTDLQCVVNVVIEDED